VRLAKPSKQIKVGNYSTQLLLISKIFTTEIGVDFEFLIGYDKDWRKMNKPNKKLGK